MSANKNEQILNSFRLFFLLHKKGIGTLFSFKEFDQLKWNVELSKKLYGISIWGDNYFNVNKHGHVEISPLGKQGPKVDLFEITKDLAQRQIRFPVLIRFSDIIHSQIQSIHSCFTKAIQDNDYKGRYFGVFPVKVNQQSHVVKDIVRSGKNHHFGLEVGSKPELLIAMSLMSSQKNLIICNGFKDKQYIEMALMFQKSGRNVFIVIERMKELPMVLETAKKLKIKAQIGFRLKLHTQSTGKWLNSSGSKSKFGLTTTEIVQGAKLLAHNKDCLKLLHFHIGSQITSIHPIKSAIKEATRFLCELHHLGFNIQYMDVGGGLGVDYDGSGQGDSSTNYNAQEYANDIVFYLQSACNENNIPHPDIVTEAGRFLVAHSSLLVFNVVDSHQNISNNSLTIEKNDHQFVQDLFEIYKNLHRTSINESFNDLIEKKKDIHQLFSYGVLNLQQIAKAEKIYWMTCSKLKEISKNKDDDIFQSLTSELTDTYFCNFSVFQSLPDSWALQHIFPVMPIHRLKEEPKRKAILVDLTCDSDGTIHQFMNYEDWTSQKHLSVHDLKKNQPYFLAVFLIGAYQEILGDLHNLFGDTEAIHISIQKNGGYSINHRVAGDCIYDVLKYVQYHRKELMEGIHTFTEEGINRGSLSRKEAGALLKQYERSLSSYTYL